MVFTLNEEKNIEQCLRSLSWCKDIIVVDSGSNDHTCEIAKRYGARVFFNQFEGFGAQRMWALQNTRPKYSWILILDADERVPDELAREMNNSVGIADSDTGAFRVRRRLYMWGRWLKHSSLYPTWVVRLVRKDRVAYVNRGHAETQVVTGKLEKLSADLIDENLKGLSEWYKRQVRYARQEAEYELSDAARLSFRELISGDAFVRRQAMKRLSTMIPFRPWTYFMYSYFLRRGFMEGRDGYIFCLMRAEFYRMVNVYKHDLIKKRRVSHKNTDSV